MAAEELTDDDAHHRGSSLGAFSEHGVAHGFIDLLRILHRNGFVELGVDICDQSGPVGTEIELH